MVAYSFQARFAEPIVSGTKTQTIRADRKRHARPGEELQLYTGMRTRQCKLVARRTCTVVLPITLMFDDEDEELEGVISPGLGLGMSLDEFAICDGFADWADLKRFWRKNHPGKDEFDGVLICWAAAIDGPASNSIGSN